MLVASACLAVFGVTAWIGFARRNRPLEYTELRRLRRSSEKLAREASMPFEYVPPGCGTAAL